MVRRALVQRVLLAIAVTMLAMFAAQKAQAQTVLYVGGGATFPTGEFGDYAKTGWQVIGGVLFPIGTPGLSAGGEVFYGQNSHNIETGVTEDSKTSPYGIHAILNYSFQTSGSLSPYVWGGAGLTVHRFSGTVLGESVSDSESKFGYQFGVGLEFGLGATTGLFVEGRYMGASGTNFFGVDAGLAFALGG